MTKQAMLAPANVQEAVEAVLSNTRILAVGARTKARLCRAPEKTAFLSMAGLSGMIEYQPDEFVFTALAGTPMREIVSALAEHRQYLPFDPVFLEAGATLGGTVAAGVNGPGRFRFGGIRDFILGIRFIDGNGRLLRMGGKVVKNAAGFDLPKFFTGSLGRFGILTEATFKVFPSPASRLSLQLHTTGSAAAAKAFMDLANSRWEPEALDFMPSGEKICVRLAGPDSALAPIAREILERWPGEVMSKLQADSWWADVREFHWAHADGPLIKIVTTPSMLASLDDAVHAVENARLYVSCGGNVAYLSLPSESGIALIQEQLQTLGLAAMTLRGNGSLWLGKHPRPQITEAVKHALDPNHRFPNLDD